MNPAHVLVWIFLDGQWKCAVEAEHNFGEITYAEAAPHRGAHLFNLIVANVLIKKRLSIEVDEPLSHNHAGWLAYI